MPWFKREVRANPAENPLIPVSSPAVLNYMAGDSETFSGRNVSERTALRSAMVWRCVDLISSTIADLPAIVYRDKTDGSRERAKGLPLYRMLRWQPNGSDVARAQGTTAFDYFKAAIMHRLLGGNHYSEIEVDNAGRPLNLWPLLPHDTEPVLRPIERDRRGNVTRSAKFIRTRIPPGAGNPAGYEVEGGYALIPPGRYLHFYGMGYDGLRGFSTIDFARQAIGAGLAMEEANARFTGQGLNSGLVIFPEPGSTMTQAAAEKLQYMIDQRAAGLSNSHRTQVFPHAFKAEKIGISPKDAQFLEERSATGRDIARFFGVPLSLVMDPEKGFSHNSVEGQQLQFLTNCIGPILTSLEQVLSLTLADPPSLFVEFLAEKMLRPDSKTLAEVVKVKIDSGVMTLDEGRRISNMPPSGHPLANQLWRPVNYMPLSMLESEGEEPPGDEDLRAVALRAYRGRIEARAHAGRTRYRIARTFRGIFSDAARRLVKREAATLRRLLAKAQNSPDGFEVAWRSEIESFYGSFRGAIATALLPFLAALDEQVLDALRDSESVAVPESFDDKRGERVAAYARIYADHHAARSLGILRNVQQKAVEAEKPVESIIDDLLAMIDQWDERQADKIGSEQAIRAATVFARAAMVAAGATAFTWVTIGKNCPLCNELAGRRTVFGQPYVAAGDTVDPGVEGTAPLTPRRDTHGPPLHGGCDCIEVEGG